MANTIVSENASFVLPSHRGLSRLEIIQDCIDKVQTLTALGIGCADHLDRKHCLRLLSMLDDWMSLAQCQLAKVLIPHAEQSAVK